MGDAPFLAAMDTTIAAAYGPSLLPKSKERADGD
jgi:hypothetical protein